MSRTPAMLIIILVLSLTGSACSYFGYKAGKYVDERGEREFPMAMEMLDDLAPEETVWLYIYGDTTIKGRFLGLVAADSSLFDAEPLPGVGEHVTVTMQFRGGSFEGDLVGYDLRNLVVRSDAGERQVRLSRVRAIGTGAGEYLDVDSMPKEVLRRRIAEISAVRVFQSDPGPIGTREIPLGTIHTVTRPTGKFFRVTGLVAGSLVDAFGLVYAAVGIYADATE